MARNLTAEILKLEKELKDDRGAGRMRPNGSWAFPRVRARINRDIERLKSELDYG